MSRIVTNTVKVHVGFNRQKQMTFKFMFAVEHTVPSLANNQPTLFVKRPDGLWWMLSREHKDGWRSINVAPQQQYQDELNAKYESLLVKYPFAV